jgi:hypothetical protein
MRINGERDVQYLYMPIIIPEAFGTTDKNAPAAIIGNMSDAHSKPSFIYMDSSDFGLAFVIKTCQVLLKRFALKWLCWTNFWSTLLGLRQLCHLGWLHSLPPSQSSSDKKLLKDLSTIQTVRTTWKKFLLSI